jgi:hypothetical protein
MTSLLCVVQWPRFLAATRDEPKGAIYGLDYFCCCDF